MELYPGKNQQKLRVRKNALDTAKWTTFLQLDCFI
jgi:hypothetical protein